MVSVGRSVDVLGRIDKIDRAPATSGRSRESVVKRGTAPSTLSQTENPPINACGSPSTRGVFTGTSNGNFNNYTSSLAAYAGQTVQIRWRLSWDPGLDEEGVYLDSIRIPNSVDPDVAFASGFEAGDSGVTTPPG